MFVALVVGAVLYLRANLITNMQRLGQPLDFSFLSDSAGIRIAGSDFRTSQSVLDALIVGVKNTLLVSIVGIMLAMLLGLVIGIARLSSNWLIARAAAIYVESIRNIPLLVIIFFWSAAVILKLPRIDAPSTFGSIVLSNRGLWVPWFVARDGFGLFVLALGIGLVVAVLVARWRTARADATGQPHHRAMWALGVFVAVVGAAYVALGAPVTGSAPDRVGRVITGGITVQPAYAALLAGLVVYTASHIAEIVRGSIQAVPKGQTEAATAIGLTPTQRLRHVVLPQASRIALPQLANQFLNLTKNSSLGIAVAYPELMSIGQINIANRAPAPQTMAIIMAFYLAMSLTIAAVADVLNRRSARVLA